MRLTESLDEWLASIERKAKATDPAGLGYTECASVEELPGAHVCGSSTTLAMNDALMRASLFAEGNFGAKRGSVVSREDPAYRQGIAYAAGHDLRAEHLVAFWEAAKHACEEKGEEYCVTPGERKLFEGYVLPRTVAGRPFVLIAFSADRAREVFSHEILHAQYFLMPTFAATADTFWAERVSAEDKAQVRQELAPVYDVTDELLVRNEFAAYVLDAWTSDPLASIAPTYRVALRDQLTNAGAPPLEMR